jgi:hypothetical protein
MTPVSAQLPRERINPLAIPLPTNKPKYARENGHNSI